MTNPDNSVGTNAAYGGRTSVNAFNDDLAGYARGIMSGWACVPNSGLIVSLGGSGSVRDVAVAEDNAGNKTTINNISGTPVDVTMSAAPGTNSRIDAIVAYVDNPPQGSSTIADNYEACGLITVQGTAAANPVAPNDSAIRTAITADGASGTTAYYAVLAYVTIASGTTDIDDSMIQTGVQARNDSYSLQEVNTGAAWVNGSQIFKKTVYISAFPNATETSVGYPLPANIFVVKIDGTATSGTNVVSLNGYRSATATNHSVGARADNSTGQVLVFSDFNASSYYGYATFYYTKS